MMASLQQFPSLGSSHGKGISMSCLIAVLFFYVISLFLFLLHSSYRPYYWRSSLRHWHCVWVHCCSIVWSSTFSRLCSTTSEGAYQNPLLHKLLRVMPLLRMNLTNGLWLVISSTRNHLDGSLIAFIWLLVAHLPSLLTSKTLVMSSWGSLMKKLPNKKGTKSKKVEAWHHLRRNAKSDESIN